MFKGVHVQLSPLARALVPPPLSFAKVYLILLSFNVCLGYCGSASVTILLVFQSKLEVVYLFIYFFVYLFIYLFIYLFN